MNLPRRWDLVVLSIGATAASLSILFSGWFTVWFQIGQRADASDYAEASGLYAGGLVWLGLATAIAWLAGAPRWLKWWCGASTGLFLVLLLAAREGAAGAADGPGWQTFGDGFDGAMTGMPWNWLVPVSLVLTLLMRGRVSAARDGA